VRNTSLYGNDIGWCVKKKAGGLSVTQGNFIFYFFLYKGKEKKCSDKNSPPKYMHGQCDRKRRDNLNIFFFKGGKKKQWKFYTYIPHQSS